MVNGIPYGGGGGGGSDSHRPIKVNNTQILSDSSSTALNLKSGNNVTVTGTSGSGDVTFSATDSKVTQTENTANGRYSLLFANTRNTTTETDTVSKNVELTYCPTEATLSVVSQSTVAYGYPTIKVQRGPDSTATAEYLTATHATSDNDYRNIHLKNSANERGIVTDVKNNGSSTITKGILTVDDNNAMKDNCVVREYIDGRVIECTQTQYDAWSQAGTLDSTVSYYITDRNTTIASYAAGVAYDNTDSGLTATNVQDAIDDVEDNSKYKVGDSINLYLAIFPGIVATAHRIITFIPLNKPLDSTINNFTLSGTIMIYSISGYITLSITNIAYVKNDLGIYLQLDVSNTLSNVSTGCSVYMSSNNSLSFSYQS